MRGRNIKKGAYRQGRYQQQLKLVDAAGAVDHTGQQVFVGGKQESHGCFQKPCARSY